MTHFTLRLSVAAAVVEVTNECGKVQVAIDLVPKIPKLLS